MKKISILKYDPELHDIRAKHNCNKCYGRGYTGFNKTTQKNQPCTCLFLTERKKDEILF